MRAIKYTLLQGTYIYIYIYILTTNNSPFCPFNSSVSLITSIHNSLADLCVFLVFNFHRWNFTFKVLSGLSALLEVLIIFQQYSLAQSDRVELTGKLLKKISWVKQRAFSSLLRKSLASWIRQSSTLRTWCMRSNWWKVLFLTRMLLFKKNSQRDFSKRNIFKKKHFSHKEREREREREMSGVFVDGRWNCNCQVWWCLFEVSLFLLVTGISVTGKMAWMDAWLGQTAYNFSSSFFPHS